MITDERTLVGLQLKVVRSTRNTAIRKNDLGLAEAALREEQSLAKRLRELDEKIAERRAALSAVDAEQPVAVTA